MLVEREIFVEKLPHGAHLQVVQHFCQGKLSTELANNTVNVAKSFSVARKELLALESKGTEARKLLEKDVTEIFDEIMHSYSSIWEDLCSGHTQQYMSVVGEIQSMWKSQCI
mmetsp:Transcript_6034/g.13138  ORF Transcript_6034/g.13138 Transcript_6034/m.13138 type:complete len:112 (+) Transcript_6034:404-739(+)